MVGHVDLVRVLSSVWELPYAGVTPMDGIVVLHSTKERPIVDLPEGSDQVLIIPLNGEVAIRVESTEGSTSTRLSEHATLLRRRGEGGGPGTHGRTSSSTRVEASSLKLDGEGSLLILYRLKQQKTVENVKKAKRAGLYPHCPAAAMQSRAGIPNSIRSGPTGVLEIERWRIRAG